VSAGRGGRSSLALAVIVPAVIAAAVTFTVVGSGERTAPQQVSGGDAASLAADAEIGPPLRPIVLRGKRSVLGTGPAGPLGGGRGAGVPVRMAIPELHVNAEIERVAATDSGIEVPQIGRAGWFEAGPRPGDPGRAVIIGHIDGPGEAGVFHHVPGIRKGAEIAVVDDEGRVHRYAATGKLQVPKDEFPADAVYGASDRPVLVLVTCGGTYEPGSGYSDNVLVYARAIS
jgi:hypothetical protein